MKFKDVKLGAQVKGTLNGEVLELIKVEKMKKLAMIFMGVDFHKDVNVVDVNTGTGHYIPEDAEEPFTVESQG